MDWSHKELKEKTDLIKLKDTEIKDLSTNYIKNNKELEKLINEHTKIGGE